DLPLTRPVTGEAGSKIPAVEQVRADIAQTFLLRNIGVDEHIGDVPLTAFLDEGYRFVDKGRGHENSVRIAFKDTLSFAGEGILIIQVEEILVNCYPILFYFGLSLFNTGKGSLPVVGFVGNSRDQGGKAENPTGSQPAGQNIGLIVQLLDNLVDLVPGLDRHPRPVMDDPVDRSDGHIGTSRYFLDAVKFRFLLLSHKMKQL